jgi:hypothetical protein
MIKHRSAGFRSVPVSGSGCEFEDSFTKIEQRTILVYQQSRSHLKVEVVETALRRRYRLF